MVTVLYQDCLPFDRPFAMYDGQIHYFVYWEESQNMEHSGMVVDWQTAHSILGVEWLGDKQKWRAVIRHGGQLYNLGSYVRLEDAVEVRKQVEVCLHDKLMWESVVEVLRDIPSD